MVSPGASWGQGQSPIPDLLAGTVPDAAMRHVRSAQWPGNLHLSFAPPGDPMAKDFDTMEDSNRSANPSMQGLGPQAAHLAARRLCCGGRTSGAAGRVRRVQGDAGQPGLAAAGAETRLPGRAPPGIGDKLVVPPGMWRPRLPPGASQSGIAGNMPALENDGSNTAVDQAAQMGMHHDGLAYFPLNGSSTTGSSRSTTSTPMTACCMWMASRT